MKKRTVSLLSALLILMLTMASCGKTEPDSATASSVPETDTSHTEENVPETASLVGYERANLPDKKFDGDDYTFWGGLPSDTAQAWQALDAVEQNAEVLNDAIYLRNRKIEADFDVKITASALSTNAKNSATITQSINANDDVYDAIFWRADLLLPLTQENYFVNYYDMPHINTSAEWWDQSVVEGFTICDQLYLGTGDISPYTNARVFSIVFNKDMCKELGLELPYSYVFEGSWTLDRFNNYISNVNSDTTGDGKMDFDDRWGFLSQEGCSYMMYFSGGGRITDIVDGKPTPSYRSERNVTLAQTALAIASDQTKTLMGDPMADAESWQAVSDWFANGGSLMRSSAFEPVPRDYRTMEADFGVLPFPKLDEAQENYCTLPSPSSIMIAFPTTCDRDFTGLITEALAAESTHTVTEAFYEKCLNAKSVRDEESRNILKIIFENKCFDVGYFLNIGNFTDNIVSLEVGGRTEVSSTFEKISKALNHDLEGFIEDYENMRNN